MQAIIQMESKAMKKQDWEYAQAVKQQRKQSKQLRSQKKQRKSIWIASE